MTPTTDLETMLFWLLVGHALCDFPLQGDFLAKAKNHKAPIPGVPWFPCLLAHSMIQAGMVMVVTENHWLALAEFLLHFSVDYMKSDGKISFCEDQAVHVFCKFVYCGWMAL